MELMSVKANNDDYQEILKTDRQIYKQAPLDAFLKICLAQCHLSQLIMGQGQILA